MNKVIKGRKRGLHWRMTERLEDLDFANDICLLAQRWSDIKAKLEKLETEAAKVGLKTKEFKTKEMRVNPITDLRLTVNGRDVEQVKSSTYEYLGSPVTTGGGALECPRTTWKRTIERELQKVGISWKEAKRLALDRNKWKSFTKALCSTQEQRERRIRRRRGGGGGRRFTFSFSF